MVMIVSGCTMSRKSSMANHDRSEWVPTYLCDNPRRSPPKESVTELSVLIFILDSIVVL